MKRATADLRFRDATVVALLALLMTNLVLLASDVVTRPFGPQHESFYFGLGVGRALALVGLLLLIVNRPLGRRRLIALALLVLTVNTASVVVLSLARNQLETIPVVTALVAFGSAVLLPWGERSQILMVAGQVLVLGAALLAVPELLPSAIVAVYTAGSLLCSVVVNRYAMGTRSELAAGAKNVSDAERRAAAFAHRIPGSVRDRTARLQEIADEWAGLCRQASHDLRAPLRTISGFSEIAMSADRVRQDAGAFDALDMVRTRARRLAERIDEFLRNARVVHRHLRTALQEQRPDASAAGDDIGEGSGARESRRPRAQQP